MIKFLRRRFNAMREQYATERVLYAVDYERERARLRYPTAHDDIMGTNHLVNEAVYRLTHMGEFPTNETARHEFIVAAALLVAAAEVIDRGHSNDG